MNGRWEIMDGRAVYDGWLLGKIMNGRCGIMNVVWEYWVEVWGRS